MSKKGYKGIGMNGIIAKWYAKITLKDFKEYQDLANRINNSFNGVKSVLEIAPGPGYLAIEIAKNNGLTVTGLDISETFVNIAKENAKEENVDVNFVVGNVSEMPFKESQFDFIVCRAAFKNFSEPLAAINEMYRVLKTGGKALIIDLRNDISDEEIISCVSKMNLNKWDKLFTVFTFKYMLRKRAYTTAQMLQLCKESRFEIYNIEKTEEGFDLCLSKD